MPRKINTEKDIVITSGAAAAARPKRVAPPARAKRPAATTAAPATSDPEQETVTSVTSVTTIVTKRQLSHEEIAAVAYALWEARGCQGGSPEEDWRRAEEHLRQMDGAEA